MRSLLRGLTEIAPVRAVVRGIGLASWARRAYHRTAAPDGIFRAEIAGVAFRLHARTGHELIWLEGAVVTNRDWSERHALETMLRFVQPGDVVYDVGANLGLYSVALAERVGAEGEVVCFEPRASTFERLKANIELNKLKHVRSFQKALGEEAARVPIYTLPDEPWRSSLIQEPDIARRKNLGVEYVEVEVGDAFRRVHELPLPRAVKIDVEGFEYAVMRGLAQTLGDPHCQFVGCEVHPHLLPDGLTVKSITDLLRSYGFCRFDIRNCGLDQKLDAYKTDTN